MSEYWCTVGHWIGPPPHESTPPSTFPTDHGTDFASETIRAAEEWGGWAASFDYSYSFLSGSYSWKIKEPRTRANGTHHPRNVTAGADTYLRTSNRGGVAEREGGRREGGVLHTRSVQKIMWLITLKLSPGWTPFRNGLFYIKLSASASFKRHNSAADPGGTGGPAEDVVSPSWVTLSVLRRFPQCYRTQQGVSYLSHTLVSVLKGLAES